MDRGLFKRKALKIGFSDPKTNDIDHSSVNTQLSNFSYTSKISRLKVI